MIPYTRARRVQLGGFATTSATLIHSRRSQELDSRNAEVDLHIDHDMRGSFIQTQLSSICSCRQVYMD